ncbi:MAG: ComF family protein [Candidatus Cryptobacteroides sp.]
MRQISPKYALMALADLILPRTCLVCGRALAVKESHICLYCLADLPYTRFENRIHNPMADKFNAMIAKSLPELSQETQREPYAYASALYFYSHDSAYRQIQYHLKYKGYRETGRFFGSLLGDRLASGGHFSDVDAVIPVPLHWTRMLRRGYNQAEIIAEAVAGRLGAPLRTDILVRCRKTATQTKLDVEAKQKNVAGAFAARPEADMDGLCHILLVDDVFTTGSTLYACFRALRQVYPPPRRISVVCLGFVG